MRSSRKDGIAMATRMRTGTMVQATSRMVLCVVREGTGFLSSLKRKITAMRRASDEDADDRDEPDEPGVKRRGGLAEPGHHVLHADAPGRRHAGCGERRSRPGRRRRPGSRPRTRPRSCTPIRIARPRSSTNVTGARRRPRSGAPPGREARSRALRRGRHDRMTVLETIARPASATGAPPRQSVRHNARGKPLRPHA